MAGWIKMPLGREVGLGPGDIVLDGESGPSYPISKGAQAACPKFLARVCYGQMAGWIKVPLGTEVGFGPGYIVLDRDPAPPPKKGQSRPHYLAMSVVAKQLDGSRSQLVWRYTSAQGTLC